MAPNTATLTMLLTVFASGFASTGLAQMGPRPELTDSQKSCLESKIGGGERRADGERPDREKMQEAFKACGIKMGERKPPRDKPADEDFASPPEKVTEKKSEKPSTETEVATRKTEGDYCESCQTSAGTAQLGRIRVDLNVINKNAEEELADAKKRAKQLAERRQLENERDRMLRKIRSIACPQGGLEEIDAADLISQFEEEKPSSSRSSRRARPGRDEDSRDEKSERVALQDSEYVTEIQDAIDSKIKKCAREAKYNGTSSTQQQMGQQQMMMQNPYGQNSQMQYMGSNPYAQMQSNPYAQMQTNPYAAMMGLQQGQQSYGGGLSNMQYAGMNSIYGSTYGGTSQYNPYANYQYNPYLASTTSAYGNINMLGLSNSTNVGSYYAQPASIFQNRSSIYGYSGGR